MKERGSYFQVERKPEETAGGTHTTHGTDHTTHGVGFARTK